MLFPMQVTASILTMRELQFENSIFPFPFWELLEVWLSTLHIRGGDLFWTEDGEKHSIYQQEIIQRPGENTTESEAS